MTRMGRMRDAWMELLRTYTPVIDRRAPTLVIRELAIGRPIDMLRRLTGQHLELTRL